MDNAVRKAKARVRDKQAAFWDNVAAAGKAARAGEAQTVRKKPSDTEKKATRQKMSA